MRQSFEATEICSSFPRIYFNLYIQRYSFSKGQHYSLRFCLFFSIVQMSNQFQLNSSFRRALTRFTASLTSEEEADFKFTTLTDVQEVLGKIQDEQGARKKMMNLHRIQIFLEGMEQFGEVIKVFLNTSPLVAFIWVRYEFLLLLLLNLLVRQMAKT